MSARVLGVLLVAGALGLSAAAQQPDTEDGDPENDERIVIEATPPASEPDEIEIGVEQTELLPGTRADAAAAVRVLPGVTRAAPGEEGIDVWGASPSSTRVYVDGIPVPRLFHMSGIRSVLGPRMVSRVELQPAAYGPYYGRSLGGVIDVGLRDPVREESATVAGADLLDLRAATRMGTDTSAALGQARLGWAQYSIAPLLRPQSRGLFPIPSYWDAQAKYTTELGDEERVSVIALASGDRLQSALFSTDPVLAGSTQRSAHFFRLGVTWQRASVFGRETTVTPWIGWDERSQRQEASSSSAYLTQRTLRLAVRADNQVSFSGALDARFGLDLETAASRLRRVGSLVTPPREGDLILVGRLPGDRQNEDRWRTTRADAGVYAQLAIRPSDALDASVGTRLAVAIVEGDQIVPARGAEPQIGYSRLRSGLDPRARVVYRILPGWSVSAAGGRYRQPPDDADLSAVFGNPRLDFSTAWHARVTNTLRFEAVTASLTAFGLWMDDLVSRPASPNPPLAAALDNLARGRSRGAQVTAQWNGDALFVLASYTFMRSERRWPRLAGWVPADHDRTHDVSVAAGWRPAPDWELGARARYTTGLPRTPVIASYFESKTGTYEPILGEPLSDRLPDFWQLDLSVARSFHMRRLELDAYLDVHNVTYTPNAEEVVYNADFTRRDYIRGLPILPVVGIRGRL